MQYLPIVFGILYLLGLGMLATSLIVDLDTEPSKKFSKDLMKVVKIGKIGGIFLLLIASVIMVYAVYSPAGGKVESALRSGKGASALKSTLDSYNEAAKIVKQ